MAFQLRAELLDDLFIVDILEALYHYKSMSIGLAQQILHFMNLISSVDSDENSSDLGCGPERNKPLRNVGSPNGYMVSRFDAKSDEGCCSPIYVTSELSIGSRVIEGSILKCILVRVKRYHCI